MRLVNHELCINLKMCANEREEQLMSKKESGEINAIRTTLHTAELDPKLHGVKGLTLL